MGNCPLNRGFQGSVIRNFDIKVIFGFGQESMERFQGRKLNKLLIHLSVPNTYQQIVTFTEASTSASSGRRATLPSAEPGGPEAYLKRMQMVGEVHQEQLEILQQHWNLMQDFGKGKLESFQQEHAMLKQKQLHLLQEVQSQLQEMSSESTCKRKVHDVTFGTGVSAPQRRGSCRVLVMGAGQLGREVCKNFKLPKWEVRNLEFDADLRMFEAQMTEFQPQVVLNLLGTELADRLSFRNFGAKTIAIASACDAHGVWLIHLSSDMVFDGTAPPYTVNAEPNPVTGHEATKPRPK